MNECEAGGMLTALGKVSSVEVLTSGSKINNKSLSVVTMEATSFARFDQYKRRSCSRTLFLSCWAGAQTRSGLDMDLYFLMAAAKCVYG